jgi:cytochrome P450
MNADGSVGCPHFPTVTAQGLDPDPLLTALRATEPVVRVQLPFGEPLWMLTRYDDVRSMLADARFSRTATIGTDIGRMSEFFPIEDSILGMDPPGHTRIRRLVSATFTARRMQALRGRAQSIVDGLLDAMERAEQPVDFVQAVALPLPITMICELLGVPFEDRATFNGWADIFMTSSGHTVEELIDAHGQLTAYLADMIVQRRVEPTDDILGALVAARDEDPTAITEGELQSLLMAILVAGYETTANQLGKFVLCLLERPDQLEILREHPELMANAVEELMRFIPLSAGSQLAYVATEDIEIGDVVIRAGEGVMPSTASANRDESEFDHADQLDVERAEILQLGFGHGNHYCLGAHLARVELQVALTSLFARFPDVRLAVPADEVRWKDGSAVWGLESLPLCFSSSEG